MFLLKFVVVVAELHANPDLKKMIKGIQDVTTLSNVFRTTRCDLKEIWVLFPTGKMMTQRYFRWFVLGEELNFSRKRELSSNLTASSLRKV